MQNKELFDVRCPFERISKSDNKLYRCNSLCGKVESGSAGELRCRKCHLSFYFSVSEDAQVQTGVRVKPIDQPVL